MTTHNGFALEIHKLRAERSKIEREGITYY